MGEGCGSEDGEPDRLQAMGACCDDLLQRAIEFAQLDEVHLTRCKVLQDGNQLSGRELPGRLKDVVPIFSRWKPSQGHGPIVNCGIEECSSLEQKRALNCACTSERAGLDCKASSSENQVVKPRIGPGRSCSGYGTTGPVDTVADSGVSVGEPTPMSSVT
jgi:hypothetical protein